MSRTSLCLLLLFSLSCQTVSQTPVVSRAISQSAVELVHLKSEDSTNLKAYVFRPKGVGPFPAVVALHGCAGLFKGDGQFNPRDQDWGERLAANGYLVVYPDSFTTREITDMCRTKTSTNFAYETRPQDALGALKWLKTQESVDATHVALMGWSNGGSALLATIDSAQANQELVSKFKLAIAFYPGCVKTEKNLTWQNRVPLEILMGELDNWTLPSACSALVARLKTQTKINITLYPNSYHDFDTPNLPLKTIENLSTASGKTYSATVGTNEEARQKAISKVLVLLKNNL